MKGFKAKLNFIHKTIKTIQCLDWCETLTINFNTINFTLGVMVSSLQRQQNICQCEKERIKFEPDDSSMRLENA